LLDSLPDKSFDLKPITNVVDHAKVRMDKVKNRTAWLRVLSERKKKVHSTDTTRVKTTKRIT